MYILMEQTSKDIKSFPLALGLRLFWLVVLLRSLWEYPLTTMIHHSGSLSTQSNAGDSPTVLSNG